MTASNPTSRSVGSALVALQFLLVAALALAAILAVGERAIPPGAWMVGLGGLALGLWAVASNRPGNFNIRPEPRAGGQLVCHGPYRWIRHPMYTAVIAIAVACAAVVGAAWAWLCVAALVAVLVAKATLEERALVDVHPDYAAYLARTRRFVPWVL